MAPKILDVGLALLRLGRAHPRPSRPEVVPTVLHPVGVAAL